MKTYDEGLGKDRVNRFPFVKLMGMKLLSCSGGKSVIRCRVREVLKNSGGRLHGGVVGTLVDMSVATALRSALPLTSRMTTVEYKVNLLKPVSEGTITARGSVIRLGSTRGVRTRDSRGATGERVALASAAFYILSVGREADSRRIVLPTTG